MVVRTIKNKKDSNSKFNKLLSSKYNKMAIIFIEVALLLTVVVLICLVVKGDISLKSPETTKYVINNTTENSIVYKEGLTFAATEKNKDNEEENVSGAVDVVNNNSGNSGSIDNSDTPNSNTLPDPSGWNRAEILAKAKSAVNKTKTYTGNLTVNHTEGFTADVKECTGGDLVKGIANLMIGWVVKPVEETLSYQNGKAVNSEGETVPIILPKRGNFTLTEDGISTASVQRSGSEYVIKIKLIEESVGMYEVPKHNAASVGYLDVANFDISFMEVDSADIVYQGSSIEFRINADGYVTKAKYTIPLHIDGSAHRGSISGSATFEGVQTEEWQLNW